MTGERLYELFCSCSDVEYDPWEFLETQDQETWDLLAQKVKLVDA